MTRSSGTPPRTANRGSAPEKGCRLGRSRPPTEPTGASGSPRARPENAQPEDEDCRHSAERELEARRRTTCMCSTCAALGRAMQSSARHKTAKPAVSQVTLLPRAPGDLQHGSTEGGGATARTYASIAGGERVGRVPEPTAHTELRLARMEHAAGQAARRAPASTQRGGGGRPERAPAPSQIVAQSLVIAEQDTFPLHALFSRGARVRSPTKPTRAQAARDPTLNSRGARATCASAYVEGRRARPCRRSQVRSSKPCSGPRGASTTREQRRGSAPCGGARPSGSSSCDALADASAVEATHVAWARRSKRRPSAAP